MAKLKNLRAGNLSNNNIKKIQEVTAEGVMEALREAPAILRILILATIREDIPEDFPDLQGENQFESF